MKLSPLFFVVALAGCAAKTGTTVPGETVNQAYGSGFDKMESIEVATRTAGDFCQKQGKRSAIDSMNTTYQGQVSESARNTSETVSDVAAAAGVWVPGLGDDDDYLTVADFRCL